VRHSMPTPNALSVAAFILFLASCSGGASQTPAISSNANSLGQTLALQRATLVPREPNTKHGFMQKMDAQTHLLYMSSWADSSVVDVLTMSGLQVGQIENGLVTPEGLFVDAKGNLWVANVTNVVVYPHGGLSPSKTLEDPTGPPTDVTVCPNGTAYVADLYDASNGNQSSIQVYAHGSTKPTGNLTYPNDFRNPYLTCDAAGNVFLALLVGQSVGDGRVVEFPLGKQQGAKDLGIVLQVPGGIKPDNAGNLLVTDLTAQTITEYTENGSPTGLSIATKTQVEDIAVTVNGHILLGGADRIAGPYGMSWSLPSGKALRVYNCCSRIGPPLQDGFGVAFYPGQKGI
jgi:hypothetical protein